jgi:glucose-1-phosphate adenylyltransferase
MGKSVLGIILGGGAGTRLYPLTKTRAKPAVPLGANYRLIDIPVSNCLNSGVTKVYCLTQFNSASLNRHLATAYQRNVGSFASRGFVEVLAASQTPVNPNWFQGTADAVRQYMWLFEEAMQDGVEDFLILSGDHLYRMDYADFVAAHRAAQADITVAALPCGDERASSFGLMKINDTGRITEFAEKPQGEALKAMQVDTTILGLNEARAKDQPYIASMGIYVAKASSLRALLKDMSGAMDFGGEIIPAATAEGYKVQAHLFDGYWEDIGTIDSFYHANLGLTGHNPNFSFYDRDAPIYTGSRYLPPSKVMGAVVDDSIIGDGCLIKKGASIKHSVVGLRSIIGSDTVIEDALMMGADFYETERDRSGAGVPVPIGVGDRSVIRKVILDKNARIGKDVQLTNKAGVKEANREAEGYIIKDGIIVVCKDAVIADGTTI